MNPIVALVKRRPLVAYFVLAYALTWSVVLLTRLSLLFAFLGLFGPAAAALIVTAIDEGRAGCVRCCGAWCSGESARSGTRWRWACRSCSGW